jgi:hypothetical protein
MLVSDACVDVQAFALHDEFIAFSTALLASFIFGTVLSLLAFFIAWGVLLLDFRVQASAAVAASPNMDCRLVD